eukprot:1036763-Pelagomonas_calceolata.AAC.2
MHTDSAQPSQTQRMQVECIQPSQTEHASRPEVQEKALPWKLLLEGHINAVCSRMPGHSFGMASVLPKCATSMSMNSAN